MRSQEISSTEHGSMLIELVVAVAIFSISCASVACIAFSNTRIIATAKVGREAIFSAKKMLENENFSVAHLTPCIRINTASLDLKSEISWHTSLFELQADASFAESVGGDCGGREPERLAATSSQTTGADLLSAIDVFDGIVFSAASSTEKFGLFAKNGSSQLIFPVDAKILSVDAIKSFLFLAAAGTSSQLRIIDTSDIKNMKEISNAALPGVSGSYPSGTAVKYFQSRVYVGTHRTAGKEFHIFDLSNPQLPTWLGAIELNHNINDIEIRWPYAFLATSGNTSHIIVVRVDDPSHLYAPVSLAFEGNEDAVAEWIIGNRLFVGRNKSNDPSHPEFLVIDISSVISPRLIGSIYLNATVAGVQVFDSIAYLALAGTVNKFIEVDASSTTDLVIRNEIMLPDKPVAFDYEDGSFYITLKSGNIYAISK